MTRVVFGLSMDVGVRANGLQGSAQRQLRKRRRREADHDPLRMAAPSGPEAPAEQSHQQAQLDGQHAGTATMPLSRQICISRIVAILRSCAVSVYQAGHGPHITSTAAPPASTTSVPMIQAEFPRAREGAPRQLHQDKQADRQRPDRTAPEKSQSR